MAQINTSSFPETIDVVLGPSWQGSNGLSENDVITLTRFVNTTSQVRYSENGTGTSNTSTNRILVEMKSSGAVSFGSTARVYAYFAFYSTKIGTTFYGVNNLVNTPLVSILGVIGTLSPYSYTFLEVFQGNNQYLSSSTITPTNNGWPKIFKSMQAGAGNQATLTGTGTVTANGVEEFAGIATILGSGTVTAAGTEEFAGNSTLNGTGTISALGGLLQQGDTTLNGIGTVTAGGEVFKLGFADIDGIGTVLADASIIRNGDSSLIGTGTVSANGVTELAGYTSISGTGTITATGVLTFEGIVNLTGTGTVISNSNVEHTGITNITSTGSIIANGAIEISGNASFNGAGTVFAKPSKTTTGFTTITNTGNVLAIGKRFPGGKATLQGNGVANGIGEVTFSIYLSGNGSVGAKATIILHPISLGGGKQASLVRPKPVLNIVTKGGLVPRITVNSLPEKQRQELRSDVHPTAPLVN